MKKIIIALFLILFFAGMFGSFLSGMGGKFRKLDGN